MTDSNTLRVAASPSTMNTIAVSVNFDEAGQQYVWVKFMSSSSGERTHRQPKPFA
jgi:hypothetical protein